MEERAGGGSLAAYVRSVLFGAAANKSKARNRNRGPVKDHSALAQVLARLGKGSPLAHLNDLATAARAGSLASGPEELGRIEQACRDIAEIKKLLMAALRVKER